MPINSLPTAIQSVIQQGFLERRFQQALRAKLGFRAIADREAFGAGIGETITKTRTGLLAAVTAPMAVAAVTDFTSGLTNQNYSVEQFTLGVAQYAAPMQLNVATARVAIDDLYLQNAYALGEQAARSVDTLAQRALFDQYMGGNSRVTTTLGAAGTAVHVDDVRGFFMTLNSQGVPVSVSSTNTLSVTVGSDVYTLTGAVADGAAPATINPWLSSLAFSGSSSNSSTTPGGFSGTLTFSANVTIADGTAGNAVVSAVAPFVMRPSATAAGNAMAGTTAAISAANDINAAKLTMQMILTAKATMSANAVPPVADAANYILYADPIHLTGLYQDPAFQYFFRGKPETTEYRRGLVAELLGCSIVETNLNPVQALSGVGTVRRAVLCGQGALVEADFTRAAYAAAEKVDDADGMITVVDGIAHVTREPLDTLKQVVTQAWSYIGGFVAPTDVTTNPNTVPTATNSALKRAVILESL
jgi:hypothetical protein